MTGLSPMRGSLSRVAPETVELMPTRTYVVLYDIEKDALMRVLEDWDRSPESIAVRSSISQ